MPKPIACILWGNHDLAYGFPLIREAYCSGFTYEKSQAINSVLNPDDWKKLHLTHWEDDFLFSHAGWSKELCRCPWATEAEPVSEVRAHLAREEAEAWQHLTFELPHWVFNVGRLRGGLSQSVGGLLWCDVREFTPIPGLNQIFGHTPGNLGTVKRGPASINLCLDTGDAVNGARHYLIIEKRRGIRYLEIKHISGDVERTIPL